MRSNPALWNDSDDFGEALPEVNSAGRRRIKRATAIATETADKALLIAHQIYGRLIGWGWLEEEEYGLRVTVDMPMGPLLVIQRLASLNKDVSQRFGGLIVTVRLNLEAVEKLNPQITDRKQREVAEADPQRAGVTIYVGGYPSLATQDALKDIAATLPADIPFFHWSDIDPDGTWIFRTIESSIARVLKPHLMSADLADKLGKPPA